MLVNMFQWATDEEVMQVIHAIKKCSCRLHLSRSEGRAVINVIDEGWMAELESLRQAPGVEEIMWDTPPFALASREFKRESTIVEVGQVRIGAEGAVVIAGPCSIESREQLLETAHAVKAAGAHLLRGGAYKPRTSPYDFQGIGVRGLELLAEARKATGLPVVTELLSTDDVDIVAEHADMLQVGARNMQNFALLRRLGNIPRPILLKRGASATIKEWLLAAEYLLAGGNPNVVLCERGIKTFEPELRNTLDLAAVARVKELSHLPVIVDPSHATGRRSLVPAASKAALAIGADGLIIEVHPEPALALSDGFQSLNFEGFARLMEHVRTPLRALATGLSREIEHCSLRSVKGAVT